MIPADVWEEILGLARGKPPAPKPEPAPEPEPGFETWQEFEAEPVPEAEERSSRRHESDLDRRRAAVARPPIQAQEVGSGRGVVTAPVPVVRRAVDDGGVRGDLFGSGSPEELRKAIILKEVLGLPLALRED
jgi:hypothetical protein